jgi:hypothetical protein
MGIRFDLKFVGDIDTSCGERAAVSANTSTTPSVQVNTTLFDYYRNTVWGYRDHPAYLQFEVTSAGNITFDSCDSLYVVHLCAIYIGPSLTFFFANTHDPVPLCSIMFYSLFDSLYVVHLCAIYIGPSQTLVVVVVSACHTRL